MAMKRKDNNNIFSLIKTNNTVFIKKYHPAKIKKGNSIVAFLAIEDSTIGSISEISKPISCWKYDKSVLTKTDLSEYFSRVKLQPGDVTRYPLILVYFDKPEDKTLLNICFMLNDKTSKVITREVIESNGSYTLGK